MEETDDPGGSLPEIHGNLTAVGNERRRFEALSDRLDDFGNQLARTRPESWEGRGRRRFEEAVGAAGKQAWRAAEACHDAAAALGSYESTLEILQRLWRSEVAAVRANPHPVIIEAARTSILRWKLQLATRGQETAARLAAANEELATIGPLLPERVQGIRPVLSLTPHPPKSAPARRAVTIRPGWSPHNPLSYDKMAQRVSDGFLRAVRGSAEA
jgi:uncharacterized protein YukE